MKRPTLRSGELRAQRGFVVLWMCLLVPPLLIFLAAVIDFGLYFVTRNELQNAADSAALAGASQLGIIYQGGSPFGEPIPSEVEAQVVAAATAAGVEDRFRNKVNGSTIEIPATDVEIGNWSNSNFSKDVLPVTPLTPINAVFVQVQRSDIVNAPIPTYFASVFGVDSLPVYAKATAFLRVDPSNYSAHLVDPRNDPYQNAPYRP